jgi:hypothetical protein
VLLKSDLDVQQTHQRFFKQAGLIFSFDELKFATNVSESATIEGKEEIIPDYVILRIVIIISLCMLALT